jgi:hypothetical protein
VDIEGSLDEIVQVASSWIAESGEVLAIARYSRAAGNRDYRLFCDPSDWSRWARSLLADCNLLVLKDYELNRRGTARSVTEDVPVETDVEWLVIVTGDGGDDRAFECWGTAEVRDVLADYGDDYVFVGRMPGWNPAVAIHAPATLSAIAPRTDGSIHRGVY